MLSAILKRRSIRKFKSDPIKEEDINEIIKAAQFAPTGMNNKSVEYIVIKDQEIKNKICEILNRFCIQNLVKEAPILIIPIIDNKKSGAIIEDLSVSNAFMMLQATELGIGTLWKHIQEEVRAEIREILQIPDKFSFINLIALGYPKNYPGLHTDAEFKLEKIHTNKYK